MDGLKQVCISIYVYFFYFNKGFRIFVVCFVFVFYYSKVSKIWLYVEMFIEPV